MTNPENKERISTADILSSIEDGIIMPIEVARAIRKAAELHHAKSTELLRRSEEIAGTLPRFYHITTYEQYMHEMSKHYSPASLNRAWNAIVRANSRSRWDVDPEIYSQIVIGRGRSSDLHYPMINLDLLKMYLHMPIFGLGELGKEIFIKADEIASEYDKASGCSE